MISTDESYLVTFEVLIEILQSKIDCLKIIPDEELIVNSIRGRQGYFHYYFAGGE